MLEGVAIDDDEELDEVDDEEPNDELDWAELLEVAFEEVDDDDGATDELDKVELGRKLLDSSEELGEAPDDEPVAEEEELDEEPLETELPVEPEELDTGSKKEDPSGDVVIPEDFALSEPVGEEETAVVPVGLVELDDELDLLREVGLAIVWLSEYELGSIDCERSLVLTVTV